MQFRTELQLPPATHKISLGHRFLTLGSCFAEVIGRRLTGYKLDTLNNPFGTIFNPVSQFELVQAALAPEEQEELPLVQQNGYWYAYNFHSSFAGTSKTELQQQIDFALTLTREQIEKADTLIFTFGTALVYQLAVSDRIVANCHKMPQSNFSKRLLLSEEVVAGFTEMFALLKSVNPKLRVILTVSPVRHVKETLVLNSVSKAVLRVACHYLAELLPDVEYFPAFELLMDDLRDYRFYKDDLLHPTEMAEQYVWEKFTETYFDQPLQQFAEQWSGIRQGLAHKPFQADSEGHQQFLQRLQEQLQGLSRTVNVKDELNLVKQQLMPVRRNQAPKKAPRELVSLLENLAASEVMAEDDAAFRKSRSQIEAGSAEAFVWPDQEEDTETIAPAGTSVDEIPVLLTDPAPFEEPLPQPTQLSDVLVTAAPAIEDVISQPAAETPAAQNPREGKKSKSKKRREKRKAKMLAARDQKAVQQLPPGAETAAAPEPAEEQAGSPVSITAETRGQQLAPAEPEIASANQPEKAAAPERGRKGRTGKQPKGKRGQAAATQAQTPLPEPAPEAPAAALPPAPMPEPQPATEAPARKKPGRKPAAGVGALLSALASAQAPAPGKPARAPRPARKTTPVTGSEPVSPQPAAAITPVTPPAISQPTPPPAAPAKAKRQPRKPIGQAPELPFTAANPPVMVAAQQPEPAPLPDSEQPNQKPAKEPKAKKEGGSRKGKARTITIKKTPAGKNSNT